MCLLHFSYLTMRETRIILTNVRYICLSVRPRVHASVLLCFPVCPSIHLCSPVHTIDIIDIYLFTCLPMCLANLSVYLSVCPYCSTPKCRPGPPIFRNSEGFHSGAVESSVLLGCDATPLGEWFPAFRRKLPTHSFRRNI